MASPHVTGIAAVLMAQHSFDSVHELYDTLRSMATRDALTFRDKQKENNNLLAFYSAGSAKV
jgi:hypothetical protein